MTATNDPMTDFRKACFTDYVETAARREQGWLLEDAEECEEAARAFTQNPDAHAEAVAEMIGVDGSRVSRRQVIDILRSMARRAEARAQEARAVARMDRRDIRRAARAIRARRAGRSGRSLTEMAPDGSDQAGEGNYHPAGKNPQKHILVRTDASPPGLEGVDDATGED